MDETISFTTSVDIELTGPRRRSGRQQRRRARHVADLSEGPRQPHRRLDDLEHAAHTLEYTVTV
jgi:hypothetical protein